MDWLWIFALLGFNALSYSAVVAFLYRFDRFTDRHPKTSSIAYWALIVLSLPGVLIFEPAFMAHSRRVYAKHINDLRTLRALAETQGEPSEREAKLYNWDTALFVDEYGHFDLRAWKSHEYEKLGL